MQRKLKMQWRPYEVRCSEHGKLQTASRTSLQEDMWSTEATGVALPKPSHLVSHHDVSLKLHMELQNTFALMSFCLALILFFFSIPLFPFWNRNV